MQNTSPLYQDILASNHWAETRVSIGETGRLISNFGETITFGGVGILVGATGADAGYDESVLYPFVTSSQVFSKDTPTVGSCVSSEIELTMLKPKGTIPRQARITPYVRITDGVRHSEWLQKGVYWLDTRYIDDSTNLETIQLHGYDSMLKAEQSYPSSTLNWPAKDVDVVKEIARAMDVGVDARTLSIMTNDYLIEYPAQYSQREVLGYIASMYAGCFIMNDFGDLRLIVLNSIPKETRYLVTQARQAILFGGDRILV